MTRFSTLGSIALIIVLLNGCSGGPSRVQQPGYSSNAGSAAIADYDANSDGVISGDELDKVPALRAAIKQVDTDNNGQITAEEIDNRIDAWRESRLGQMPAFCEIRLNGAPLANAEIVWEPEPFLGSSLVSGKGTTGDDGFAAVKQESGQTGLPCGFYKIRVTSPNHDIPARYNTETTLGCEVAQYSHWQNAGAVKLNLTTK